MRMERLMAMLAGGWMTALGGVALAADLTAGWGGLALPLRPAWATVAICGLPLLWLAVRRLVCNRGILRISSALLISIAMGAAVAIGDLFAAGEVAFIMALGALLEERTVNRAKRGLRRLIDLAPSSARRLTPAGEEILPAAEIRPGDRLLIRPGERVPTDARIVSGETSVDQSLLTGESLPVDRGPGDELFCGTLNRFGAVEAIATHVGEDDSLRRLVRLMREAESRQAPTQRLADRWAAWLVPAALLIALAALIGTGDLTVAVTVLVVFCPCALVLATPTAIMAAVGQAARRGVIVKSGAALERMDHVDVVAFDKTGTLSQGRLTVTDLLPAPGQTPEGLLTLCAAAERLSEHPLGRAVAAHAQTLGLTPPTAEDFAMTLGRGVRATLQGREIRCGTEAFLAQGGAFPPPEAQSALAALRTQGKAAILVSLGGDYMGAVALADAPRPHAADALARLRALGVYTLLLTGDTPAAADWLARQTGLGDVRAGLLPEDKVRALEDLRAQGHVPCMVGDGVNDAPALRTAAVGVAMGGVGSAITVEAADIALVGDDLRALPYLRRLAQATLATIRLGITLSMAINAIAILLSLLRLLTPTTGALVHNAGSCLVILIAAALYDREFD